jgi:hypothetical protein
MVVFLSFSVIVLTVVVALAIAAAASAPHLTQVADDMPKSANLPKSVVRGQAVYQVQSHTSVSTTVLTSPPLVFAAGLQ